MDPVLSCVVMILLMLLLISIGLPIGFALILVGFLGILLLTDWGPALSALSSIPYRSTSEWTLSVIPLFVLMGHFALQAGVSRDFFLFASRWLSWLPGGLCIVSVAGCAGFAFCTGSTVACATTVARVALPEMERYGYDRKLSAGTLAAAGTLGTLIPPSIGLVIYGMMTGQPIGRLLIAGIVPGIVSAAIYMIMIGVRATIHPEIAPRLQRVTWPERIASVKGVVGIFVLAASVLGVIFAGVATPTEAAALGALVAVFMALVRRKLTWGGFKEALVETGKLTSTVFVIYVGAVVFTCFLGLTGIPVKLSLFIQSMNLPPLIVLSIIFVMYIFLGCIIDPISMCMLTLPVVFPLIVSMGYDPIWFGIMVIKMTEIGMITPPVGLNVYAIKAASGYSLEEVFRGIFPFFWTELVIVAILVAFPQIVLWLPGKMFS